MPGHVEPGTIRVNGVERALTHPTLVALLAELGYGPGDAGIAAAVNGTVVPRGAWSEHALRPGDEVELVGAVQGG
jgi:sulfur carrier protein